MFRIFGVRERVLNAVKKEDENNKKYFGIFPIKIKPDFHHVFVKMMGREHCVLKRQFVFYLLTTPHTQDQHANINIYTESKLPRLKEQFYQK